MSITVTVFRDGRAQEPQPFDEQALGRLRDDPDALLWLDDDEPSAEELDTLQRVLDLPELAVESVRDGHQRPKIDTYDDCALVVAYEVGVADAPHHRLQLTELSLFVGHDFLLSVRSAKAPEDDVLQHRLTTTEGRRLHSSTAMVHALLDTVVDSYFSVLERMEQRIEDIDRKAYGGLGEHDIRRAFTLRRDLVRFRRVVAPLRELLNAMVRREGGVLDDSVDEHLRDLYDHVVTVYEDIEMARDLLAGDLEAHLSAVSNRMNEIVLKVSAWAAIIAAPTVIASIYGMNFIHMPELRWRIGYPGALLLMLGVVLGLYAYFKRRQWL